MSMYQLDAHLEVHRAHSRHSTLPCAAPLTRHGAQVGDFNSATGYPRAAPSKPAPASVGEAQGEASAALPPPKLTKEQKKAYGDNTPFFSRSARERGRL